MIVWQLADQIRILVFKLTERERFVRDIKLHSQTEDAVNSVCRNVAEGFGCKHKEFARFLVISRRSLNELRDSFRTAQLKRYVTAHEYEPIWRLTHRLYPAYAELIAYLLATPDPDPTRARKPRTDSTDPAKPTRTNRAKRARTNLEPTCTNATPACTDPAQPTRTNPRPTRTNPAQPARTDPAQPARTDPAKLTRTNRAKRARTNPEPTCTNPTPACTDPKPAPTDPAQRARTNPRPT